MFLEDSTWNFSLLSEEEDTDMVVTTKSVGRFTNFSRERISEKKQTTGKFLSVFLLSTLHVKVT